ncbi:MAG: putative zinc-binding protein [Promethearchaeota archaeon]
MTENEQKIGIISCTGVSSDSRCSKEGLIARQAMYKVIEDFRPDKTLLVCLPALAGEVEEDVIFVRDYPTIVIEGCPDDCSTKVLGRFDTKQIFSTYYVRDFIKDIELSDSLINLSPEEDAIAERIAERVALDVDKILQSKNK